MDAVCFIIRVISNSSQSIELSWSLPDEPRANPDARSDREKYRSGQDFRV
jgi:hypothetical protein